uniref:Integrase catalytic domain-containing protein n=1 Tax=Globodera pallida TaxID=36090 RepID=A0A183C156_GLOPA
MSASALTKLPTSAREAGGLIFWFSCWGYYGRSLGICAETKLNVFYEKVEGIFRGMWTKYNLIHASCQHWARDFYNRVGEESTEAFHAYRHRIGFEVFSPMTGR